MPYLNRLWPPGQRYEVTIRAARPETREVHWRGEAPSAEAAIRSARAAWSNSFGAVPDDALISCDRASEPCQACSGRGWVPTDHTETPRERPENLISCVASDPVLPAVASTPKQLIGTRTVAAT
jgi:hypothetical protein